MRAGLLASYHFRVTADPGTATGPKGKGGEPLEDWAVAVKRLTGKWAYMGPSLSEIDDERDLRVEYTPTRTNPALFPIIGHYS